MAESKIGPKLAAQLALPPRRLFADATEARSVAGPKPIEVARQALESAVRQKIETNNRFSETENHRARGRPRRQTEPPWISAGVSRAAWYRQKKGK